MSQKKKSTIEFLKGIKKDLYITKKDNRYNNYIKVSNVKKFKIGKNR